MRRRQRFNFIDVAKAFASYFIVMVHTITPNNLPGFKLTQIGAMALFFFASGFLFKESYTDIPFKEFLKKIARKCLIPYFIGAAVGIVVTRLFPYWYGQYSFKDILEHIFILGGPIAFGATWYLMCIFFIEIVFYLFIKSIKSFKPQYKVFYLMIFIIFFFLVAKLCVRYYSRPIFIKIPLKIDSAFTGIIYFALGYLFKELKFYKLLDSKMLCVLIFLITKPMSLFLEHRYLGYTNICDCIYDNYNMYFFIQLLGIASFVSLGAIFADVKVLQNLGANNLLIYLLHTYVLWFLQEVYGRIVGEVKFVFYNPIEIIFLTTITYVITAFIAYHADRLYRKWRPLWLKRMKQN